MKLQISTISTRHDTY